MLGLENTARITELHAGTRCRGSCSAEGKEAADRDRRVGTEGNLYHPFPGSPCPEPHNPTCLPEGEPRIVL